MPKILGFHAKWAPSGIWILLFPQDNSVKLSSNLLQTLTVVLQSLVWTFFNNVLFFTDDPVVGGWESSHDFKDVLLSWFWREPAVVPTNGISLFSNGLRCLLSSCEDRASIKNTRLNSGEKGALYWIALHDVPLSNYCPTSKWGW